MSRRGTSAWWPDRGTWANLLWTVAPSAFAAVLVVALVEAGELTRVFKLLLLLAAVAVAARALVKPEVALHATIVLAVVDRSVAVGGSDSTVQVSVAALVLFAPAFLMSWAQQTVPRPVRVGVALLLLGSVIATISAEDSGAAVVGSLRWFLIANVIIGSLGMIARDPAVLRRLAYTLVAMGVVAGAFGWLQEHGVYTFVGPAYDEVPDSTFGYYSNFANFEAIVFVIALGLTLEALLSRRLRVLALAAAALVSSVYSILITQSRGAVVLIVVGLVVLILTRIRRVLVLSVAVVSIVVLLGGIYLLLPDAVLSPYEQRFLTAQGGDVARFQLQAGGFELFTRNPLGVGFDNFQAAVASGQVSADVALAHSHNLFLQIGLDTGWLGFAGFALLVAVAAWVSIRRGVSQAGRGLHVAFGAALAGTLVQGWNDYFFFEPGSLIAFAALVIGALAGARSGDRPPPLLDGDEVRTSEEEPGPVARHAPAASGRLVRQVS